MPYKDPEARRKYERERRAKRREIAVRYMRAWVQANPAAVKKYEVVRKRKDPHRVRAWRLQKEFGITLRQYDKMLDLQGGVCAICLNSPKSGRRLDTDHDHKTGRVRGLLCWWCNRYIATKRITSSGLRRAADYLDSTFDGRNLQEDS